ncbi:hypothetical protein BAE44_0025870 [Dichanthelium oligosanthes]|uniref:RRM domain-containing protein n=1 Tax=Dichanthelium oligosanthes TaxID=888268 RepID=A0A1E5UJP9_9POAL|nr:hypothetical protein BAE44_0025870 [Dichanthelium oligosanthes]
MALPLARLLLPALPACQCQPPLCLRFPKRHVVSFVAPATACSRGHRAAFAACAAASAPAAPAPAVTEAEAAQEEQVVPRTRLVAQNIPWDCTADDMRALFGKHGSVVGVEKLMGRPINVMFKEESAKKNKSSVPKEEDAQVESSEQGDS